MFGLGRKKKIRINKEGRYMYDVFGIPENRALELIGGLAIIWQDFLSKDGNTKNIGEVLEKGINLARDKKEECFISYLVGSLVEQYRIGIELMEKAQETIEKMKDNVSDDKMFG